MVKKLAFRSQETCSPPTNRQIILILILIGVGFVGIYVVTRLMFKWKMEEFQEEGEGEEKEEKGIGEDATPDEDVVYDGPDEDEDAIVVSNPSSTGTGINIPRVIWTYWEGDTVPTIIQECIKSWAIFNPTYVINVITKENINDYIPTSEELMALPRIDGPARLSDFIRLEVLTAYGGIWMDASIICTSTLEWIFDGENRDFIGFYMPNFTTLPLLPVIESWFIAAPTKSPFIKAWRDEFYSTNEYESMEEYIQDMKTRRGIDLQNLAMPEYLTIHAAAQAVMQTGKYSIKALDATSGPFKYLARNEWDSIKSLDALCKHPEAYRTPLIKLRGDDRKKLEGNNELIQCIVHDIPIKKTAQADVDRYVHVHPI
jgi:hypothetical protein